MIDIHTPTYDEMVKNRDGLIADNEKLFTYVRETLGIFVNLGCGYRIMPGFCNVDKYIRRTDYKTVRSDMTFLPFKEGTVDLIFACHSLEHLPIRHATLCLRDCHRVLKKGGKLILELPDFEIIMTVLLDPNTTDRQYTWYMYTLFGYQANSEHPDTIDAPVDPGQFHTNGFSKRKLYEQLLATQFDVTTLFNYEGWGTPGIRVDAVKV